MGARLEGKIAIITGGTSGIGEATAEAFVKEGASVLIAGRSVEKGEKVAARLGEKALYQKADVMNEADIKALIDLAMDRFGRIDCLFNNAAANSKGTLESVTQEDFAYSMNLLLGSVVFGLKHVSPIMKKQQSGSIINNSSIAALRANQGFYLYSLAKAAVTHLSVIAGTELGPFGVRVNSISPGSIATPIFWGGSERANLLSEEENERKMNKLIKNLAKATSLPKAGLPYDVAMAAVYLASDESGFMNCQDLVVDGGRTALFNETP